MFKWKSVKDPEKASHVQLQQNVISKHDRSYTNLVGPQKTSPVSLSIEGLDESH